MPRKVRKKFGFLVKFFQNFQKNFRKNFKIFFENFFSLFGPHFFGEKKKNFPQLVYGLVVRILRLNRQELCHKYNRNLIKTKGSFYQNFYQFFYQNFYHFFVNFFRFFAQNFYQNFLSNPPNIHSNIMRNFLAKFSKYSSKSTIFSKFNLPVLLTKNNFFSILTKVEIFCQSQSQFP